MTWAESRVGRSFSKTTLFLRRQLWVWPILAVVILSVIGYAMRSGIERTMKANLHSGLKSFRNIETEMLLTWFEVQESNAETQANDREIRQLVYQLLDDQSQAELDTSTVLRDLEKSLSPAISSHEYVGYIIADKTQEILAASYSSLIGRSKVPEFDQFLNRAFDGETVVSPPFRSVVPLKDSTGELSSGEPVMFVCAPIRDDSFQVVAVLGFQIRPEREFTRVLQLGRVGDSGETYAFNRDGLMVSNSRFDDEMILLGLLPDEPGSQSLLKLQVRDPGGNMTEGFRPDRRRSKLPLTKMSGDAIAGNTNEDLEGYRDYRGVQVVGAWTWLSKYEIGITTEVDVAQAYRPLMILKRTFWGLYVLLGIAALAIFIFTIIVARLRREAQLAAIETQQLGQYRLEEKIGAGAMGVVYKAYHAMLRRPTAVKMLDVDIVDDQSIARFEREVQITCQLNNPNTVAIYDYGRTPEGIFYYAMEYLDGIDLQTLVERYGPQPESRVIQILIQICDSLFEAHSSGLVHRDIKPANMMLNRRGGIPDFVKVLDFGLVKAVDGEKQQQMTSAGSLTGTPLYMSPEAIQTPRSIDARSDIYAVGAVGYFLLTGRPVFEAASLVELCNMHVTSTPAAPSEQAPGSVSSELETAILACLEKSISKRPQTARDLALMLKRSPAANQWRAEEADAWWSKHEREQHIASPPILSKTVANPPDRSDGTDHDRTIIED